MPQRLNLSIRFQKACEIVMNCESNRKPVKTKRFDPDNWTSGGEFDRTPSSTTAEATPYKCCVCQLKQTSPEDLISLISDVVKKQIAPLQQGFQDFEKKTLGEFKVTQSDVTKSLTTIIDVNEGAFQKFGIPSPANTVEEFFE